MRTYLRSEAEEIQSCEVRSMRGKLLVLVGLVCILVIPAAGSDEPASLTDPPAALGLPRALR